MSEGLSIGGIGSDVTREVRLAETFVALADTLVDDFDVVDLLDQLVSSCTSLLEASAAGILLLDSRGRLQLVASSSEESRLLELFALQTDEGPCLECVRSGSPVSVADVTAEPQRWPRFAAAAAAAGLVGINALPLRLREQVIGGLNIFHAQPARLGPDEERIAKALADASSIAIIQQRAAARSTLLAEQLQAALDTRIVIEQAKGVLAQSGGIGVAAAFDSLRRFARNHNLKLGEVAAAVVARQLDAEQVLTVRAHVQPR
ncbi:MAG TPA: GAF and ANTAR domain-containing protein [Motilibacteraceae bacterium]|nr:GAF and ANTAR domain-containing protein [Motilibacteraceae bacterium]